MRRLSFEITLLLVVLKGYVVLIGIDIKVFDLALSATPFLLPWKLQVMELVEDRLSGDFGSQADCRIPPLR